MTVPLRLGSALLIAMLAASPTAWPEEHANAEDRCQVPSDVGTNSPSHYRTFNDGTVTDLSTGLTWEVKDTGVGIHSVDRTFTWSNSGTQPDGTAFTVFLETLNNTCSQDEAFACTRNADCQGLGNGRCGYAGHRDWRLPTIKELQSIVDYARFQPAIDPIFGPTRPRDIPGPNYWSSTTYAQHDHFALFVNFDTGFALSDGKVFTFFGIGLPVRAVRNDQP